MDLDEVLEEISRNEMIDIKKFDENDISVFIDWEDGFSEFVARIYPESKMAEFLEIEEEWDELVAAIKEEYKEVPEIHKLVNYLNKEGYRIIY